MIRRNADVDSSARRRQLLSAAPPRGLRDHLAGGDAGAPRCRSRGTDPDHRLQGPGRPSRDGGPRCAARARLVLARPRVALARSPRPAPARAAQRCRVRASRSTVPAGRDRLVADGRDVARPDRASAQSRPAVDPVRARPMAPLRAQARSLAPDVGPPRTARAARRAAHGTPHASRLLGRGPLDLLLGTHARGGARRRAPDGELRCDPPGRGDRVP
jgi:hypothetical protein